MKTKRYSQFGTFSVIMLSLLLIFSVTMALTYGKEDRFVLMLFVILAGISVISLLMFYKLVIEIDGTTIRFIMGIGFCSHRYRIDSLSHCRSVNNSYLTGFGIRKIRKGWLYNVSGSKAVELCFIHSDKVIRIGTDRPEEIASIITGIINPDPNEEYRSGPDFKSRNSIIALVVTLLAISGYLFHEYQPVKIDLLPDRMEIKGNYGFPVNYHFISSIDTLSRMPHIEMRTNGIGIGRVCKGHFRLTGTGDALLFINTGIQPFIKIKLKNDQIIYFNSENRESTLNLFHKIRAKIK